MLSPNYRFTKKVVLLTGLMLILTALTSGMVVCAQGGPPRRDQYVRLDTTKGPIIIQVFYSIVPYTAGNFLDLVSRNFYDGLSFHRVENWVVQGGDPLGNGTGNFVDPDTGQPRFLKLEVNQRLNQNSPGMVAMARSANPNSASCQFYILKKGMPQLNGQYAVFGRVVRGMDSVFAMQRGDRITSARILQPGGGGGGGEQQSGGDEERPQTYSGPPPSGDSGF